MIYPPNAIHAVRALYGADSYRSASGDGRVKWKDGHETTAEETAAIDAKVIELQAEYDAQDYARNRKLEYDVLNQFELISDDDANGTTTHKDAITAIKTKWPKDNSGPVE